MKSLLIMRHAKSAYPPDVTDDFHRPLSRRGREDAPRMGRVLAVCGARPDAILCSSAARAAATGKAVAAVLDFPATAIRLEQRLYQAAPETFLQAVSDLPDAVDVLLVIAHNPGVEEWVKALCGANVRLPTAALAAIELPMSRWPDIERVRGQLQWLVIPRLVKKIG